MRNKTQVNRMMLNLLDSHDTHRFFTEVGKNKDCLLAAVALEMVFLGAPCLYYGTEICMEGGYDPDSRRCFDWEESHWDKDVFGVIQKLIAIHKLDEVRDGEIRVHAKQEMLLVERKREDEKLDLYINMTEQEKEIPVMGKKVLCQNKTREISDRVMIGAGGFLIIRGKGTES